MIHLHTYSIGGSRSVCAKLIEASLREASGEKSADIIVGGSGRAGRNPREAPCRRSVATQVPKVELEPTPSCEHRILSPARLPFL